MSQTTTADELPNSCDRSTPASHLMLGLPDAARLESLTAALRTAGWPADALVRFTPRESAEETEALNEAASPLAGFGDDITLRRRYLELAREGHCWLLVKADQSAAAARAAQIARTRGATLAVHYRRLVVEELL